jgi:hypothetical protein
LEKKFEDAQIKIISKVIDGMHRNQSFTEGLKILLHSVQMTDSKNRTTLDSLMKKQDNLPLRIITSKLMD